MRTRRTFLLNSSTTAAAAVAVLNSRGLERLFAASAEVAERPATEVAMDEAYWRVVQEAFTLDRTMINLNNGGCSPAPRVVHEAFKRYLDHSNQAPSFYMWREVEPGIENARRGLGIDTGVDPETIAITRNASESLQIAQLGLDLKPGDEVLTTNQDYGRMLQTYDQRALRDGIKVVKISFPVPATSADLVKRFEAAITPRTKLMHFCHITNLTGQIFPVKELAALARSRGITSIVDGAHAYGHFPFKLSDFDADFYGTSLHKWLLTPIGAGFMYVRKDRIAGHWALQPAPESMKANIRKFEEIGTHPAANHNAISEALVFQQGIGMERKAARLRYLRNRWAERLLKNPRIVLHTPLDPALSCAIGTVQIKGVPTGDVGSKLWSDYRIFSTPIVHPEFEGLRVTPNIYTTIDEIDRFADAMERIAKT
ncbi:MAG: aminotransferase class V-fold PLP-dependent enzyme [Acidobacteria bacterium]|nr:MAG: aminotransferase class V-fold PLP-dependent enzyme [Acidobacteriota bacterium]